MTTSRRPPPPRRTSRTPPDITLPRAHAQPSCASAGAIAFFGNASRNAAPSVRHAHTSWAARRYALDCRHARGPRITVGPLESPPSPLSGGAADRRVRFSGGFRSAITPRSTAASVTLSDGGVQTCTARCSVIHPVSSTSDSPVNANVASAAEFTGTVARGTGSRRSSSRSGAANVLRTADRPVFPIPKCCRTSRRAKLFSVWLM